LLDHHPEYQQSGPVVDPRGKLLGTHDGIHQFTIGQRRGLRIAMGYPAYVVRIDPAANTVVLGPKEMLLRRRLRASGANWLIDPPAESFSGIVKIRYNHSGCLARIIPLADPPGSVRVDFDQPVSAITPGQAAVFYRQDELGLRTIGGAWIDEALDT
jgi:tRNA-specific 2-thiouridylase